MRAICSNAVGLVDRLVELPCPLRVTMQRPRPSSCSLSMNSVSMLSMPADWTTPGGSNPEHRCTPPTSMLKACGRHFRRHAANARPIGRPRPKAPATLPIRRERRWTVLKTWSIGSISDSIGLDGFGAKACGTMAEARARPVAAVAGAPAGGIALLVAQMLGQLGPKRSLDQGLLQLLEQPVLAGQVFGLLVVSKQLIKKFGCYRRRSHVSLLDK